MSGESFFELGNPTHVKFDGMTRINSAKFWASFYGNTMSMEFDVWLDDQSEERQDALAEIFNNQLSDDRLKVLIENCHYKLKHDELSDYWLRSSCLGTMLDARGFRILAVIERVKSFNFETMSPVMKCTLLIGDRVESSNNSGPPTPNSTRIFPNRFSP